MTKLQQTDYLRDVLGFDLSYRSGKYLHPKCGRCDALVINGIATHEHLCPNAKHECHGCNAMIPFNQRYCEDCNS